MRRLLATLVALAIAGSAVAQTVAPLPAYVPPSSSLDLGNGPIGLHFVFGTAQVLTSSGSGLGSTSGSSTSLSLTATPTTIPCTGCIISGTGVTSGTTVSAYNGVTQITLSAAMNVATGTTLSWGAACPGTLPATPAIPLQASPGGDYTFYTQARICAYAPGGQGAAVLPFATGAH